MKSYLSLKNDVLWPLTCKTRQRDVTQRFLKGLQEAQMVPVGAIWWVKKWSHGGLQIFQLFLLSPSVSSFFPSILKSTADLSSSALAFAEVEKHDRVYYKSTFKISIAFFILRNTMYDFLDSLVCIPSEALATIQSCLSVIGVTIFTPLPSPIASASHLLVHLEIKKNSKDATNLVEKQVQ